MAAPTKYVPSFSFSGYQATQPDRPLPGPRVDTEYFNISESLGGTIDALADIRRDDGELQNGIVDWDALDPEIQVDFDAILADIEAARLAAIADIEAAGDAASAAIQADIARAEAAADLAEQWALAAQLIIIQDTPPMPLATQRLWWDSNSGQLFVSYPDGTSEQWVQISGPAPGPAGPTGVAGPAGATGPAGAASTVPGPSSPSYLRWAAGDETTPISVGTGKVTDRLPYAFTATGLKASLNTAQASGAIFTVDFKWWNGSAFVTALSTLLTFDNTETSSLTAAAQAVLSKTSFADDDIIRIDVTQVGSGSACGLKVTLLGQKT